MRTLAAFLFVMGLFIWAGAQEKEPITIGHMDTVRSEILGEDRPIWIYVPQGGGAIYAPRKYPVVYLLDGDGHFFSVVGMIRQLSAMNGNTFMPPMMVVGIPNTNRNRDLTPTKGDPNHPFIDSTFAAATGGGETFLEFILKELVPYIESNYETEPFRMLIGHSLGGLTAMHAFLNHSDVFNAFVSIDPSMWWSNRQLLAEIKEKLPEKTYKRTSLYLSIANTMEEGMAVEQVRKDTTFFTDHIRSIFELAEYLEDNTPNGVRYAYKYYPDDTHGSVPLISEYEAFRFIFDFYPLKIGPKDFTDPELDLSAKIKAHFDQLSEALGYPTKPDESMLNNIAYQFMSLRQYDKSEKFFKMNVELYPESANVYDSLGDFYRETGKKNKAIESFKKALGIKENPVSREKLEKLTAE